MHEFSIATEIVESLLDFAAAHQPGTVLKVRLHVGELTCLEPEHLQTCYDSIIQGTPLEKSELEIERLPAAVRCLNCSYAGPPRSRDAPLSARALPALQCPHCGWAAEPTQGHECLLKTIQFEQPEAAVAAV